MSTSEKALQDKATAKTSDDLNFNSDKTTNMTDINKLKIDVEASIEVYGVITRSQAKSTAIDTATANVKSLSDKVASRDLNKPKTLKFIVKSSEKEKNFTLKKKSKRQACTQEDDLEQGQLLYNRIFAQYCNPVVQTKKIKELSSDEETPKETTLLQDVLNSRNMSVDRLKEVYQQLSEDTAEQIKKHYIIADYAEQISSALMLRAKICQRMLIKRTFNLFHSDSNLQEKYNNLWEVFCKAKFPNKKLDSIIKLKTLYYLIIQFPELLFTVTPASTLETSKSATQLQAFMHRKL